MSEIKQQNLKKMQEVAGEEVRFYKERESHDATIKDNMNFRRKVLSAVGFLAGIPVAPPP